MSEADVITRDLQKGSAALIVLSLLEGRERHGYDLARMIGDGSGNLVRFHVSSLYPLLYKLEKQGLVQGRWVEKPNERRRRFYRLTPAGRKALAAQRRTWRQFVGALERLTGFGHA